MIEFTDILLGSTLPLHPYLTDHPSLSLRLIVDGKICGETPLVNGDLATGIWETNSSLRAYSVEQSITLLVVAKKNCLWIRFASANLSVVELRTRVKAHSGYHEFTIMNSSSSMQLLMTCLIKASRSFIVDNPPSSVVAHGNQANDRHGREALSNNSKLPSRADLESFHAKAIRMPDRNGGKARVLYLLGRAYHALYEEERERADLENAVSLYDEAMRFTGPLHPQLAEHAQAFSAALIAIFRQSGDLVDIEQAILHCQTAVTLTEDLDADKPRRLSNLGTALHLRFQRTGDHGDIENSISDFRKAIERTPDGHPDKPRLLNNLGDAFQSRFKHLGSLVDMEDAISNFRKAIELTLDGHPDMPGWLNNLGSALNYRFERLGNLADMEDAISNSRKAVELTPNGHPDKPDLLDGLGVALQSRFKRYGSLADIDNAILNQQNAVESTPDGHPDKPRRLNNLEVALELRFQRLGSLADIDDAISSQQRAVESIPDSHPHKPTLLSNLGNALHHRFEHLGSLADLDDAISKKQKAVEIMPDGHPNKSNLLGNLGIALAARFQRFGSLADIDNAISAQQKAIKFRSDDHPRKPSDFTNLGSALQRRFNYLGSLADLDDAILNQEKAVRFTPDGHPDKPGWLNNLGSALNYRFQRLGNLADMEDAISNSRKAVELTPNGHPNQPGYLNNLGNALRSRFKRLGHLADIDDAISNQRKAVEFTPDIHHVKPHWLSNLGITLLYRFERPSSLADPDAAMSNFRRAIDLAPDGHPGKPALLCNLADGFLIRFGDLGAPRDLDSALSALSTAAKSTSGPAMVRFDAARKWASFAGSFSRSPPDAFGCAIDLLPRIAWLGLAVTDQHALLADVGGIVRDAVAAAIRYKEYETAVVWAEQGPVDSLRRAHPQLAARLQNIARQLEGSASHDTLRNEEHAVPVEDVSRRYSKLAIEWDSLIDEIRRIPHFEGFLRPKSFSQLAPAAHEGPVVILNINDSRCDALVLIADDSAERHVSVINIPLGRFSNEKSKNLFQALTGLLSSAGVRDRNDRMTGRAQSQADDEAKFKRILHILWQDVVKPVIEGLAFQTGSKRPPRIWWCATGLLAFLPIHAAGLYDTQEIGHKASDYVVSSYTPTLNAILELSEPAVRDEFQILMVAQASAPDAPPIPKTEDEVRIVHRLTAGAQRMSLMREKATVERVREGMIESNWIHLACHGQQNPEDPMESGFLLYDKILKLSEIVKMSLPKADFAFLSACQTAMGDEKVAEESVHLAAGMLLSGCRGVIATTWSIRDDDAPKIAEDVYSRIFKDGKPNRKEAAYALHEAVKRLAIHTYRAVMNVPDLYLAWLVWHALERMNTFVVVL